MPNGPPALHAIAAANRGSAVVIRAGTDPTLGSAKPAQDRGFPSARDCCPCERERRARVMPLFCVQLAFAAGAGRSMLRHGPEKWLEQTHRQYSRGRRKPRQELVYTKASGRAARDGGEFRQASGR